LRFAGLIEAERAAGRPLPWDAHALHRLWSERYAAEDYPETDDDIVFDSRVASRQRQGKSKATPKDR
jgi:hypothetical protein